MKARGADRAELSRQAANAMFFKWGERPSVVAVSQVTATGSNTDIARDLEAWGKAVRRQVEAAFAALRHAARRLEPGSKAEALALLGQRHAGRLGLAAVAAPLRVC